MGFISSAEHWFARVGHEVALEAKKLTADPSVGQADIALAAKAAENVLPQFTIAIEGIASGMEATWGKVCAAIHAGEAVEGGFIKIAADEAFIQSVKDAIQSMNLIKPGTTTVATTLQNSTQAKS